MIRQLSAFCFAAVLATGMAMAETRYTLLDFSDLDGWSEDDHQQALEVFTATCGDIDRPEWEGVCALAKEGQAARQFFETFFTPVLVEDGQEALFTGYFEPELSGSLTRNGQYQFPLYRLPPDLQQPWLTRQQIEEDAALEGRGLEIAWIDDPVDVFFLQVQGSGRVRLENGDVIRVGYAGANGQPYSSIGSELVRRGIYKPHQVSAEVIRNWVRRNPEEGRELLWTNESFVFFREVNEVPAEMGPLGAMNRSVTTLRTLAVDPAYVLLGAPVWMEKGGDDPMRRLMVAQDTGSAIKGAQRADIFFGTGQQAGQRAGRVKDPGRMVVLMPIQVAMSLRPETVR